MIASPDWDFLLAILGIVIALCATTFTAGWLIARLLKVDRPEKASLMFALVTKLALASHRVELAGTDHQDRRGPIRLERKPAPHEMPHHPWLRRTDQALVNLLGIDK